MSFLLINKKTAHNFDIIKKYEAGLALNGNEVKSIKSGASSIVGAYATFKTAGEAVIEGFKIPGYSKSAYGSDPERPKKLLLTKKEIQEIRQYLSQKGLTAVPLSIYTKGGIIKAEIAVVKPRKKYDKRELLKKRDAERQARRHPTIDI